MKRPQFDEDAIYMPKTDRSLLQPATKQTKKTVNCRK
jgi:hypothetical protein